MRELPGACGGQNGELDKSPAHDTRVGGLRLVTEFRLTFLERKKNISISILIIQTVAIDWIWGNPYPLVHLFTTDIVQPAVQILDTLHDILDFVLILSLNLAGLTNGKVDGELDGAQRVGQPAGGGIRFRCEADSVLARIRGGEMEATRVAVPLGHDAVIIVEGLLDGDVHLQAMVDRVGAALGVDDFRLETAYSW